jgi:serine/threonine protein phosphatase 1
MDEVGAKVTAKTYVIADLHGRNDLLEAALAKIEAKPPGRIVFTGDYIDRGPESRQIIERLLAGPRLAGWRWICLKGNHEAMAIEALAGGKKLIRWLDNGGDATLKSYGQTIADFAAFGLRERGHVAWLDRLPLYFQDERRVYVHAGVDARAPIETQSPDTLLWKRYRPGVDEGLGDRHLVHGHDPFQEGPILLARRTDLDTGAVFTGRLVVGVFEDGAAGGPVDLIECIL